MSRGHKTCERGCYTSCNPKTAMTNIQPATVVHGIAHERLHVAANFRCLRLWLQLELWLAFVAQLTQPLSVRIIRKRTMATVRQVCQVPARKWRQYATQQKFTSHYWLSWGHSTCQRLTKLTPCRCPKREQLIHGGAAPCK